MSNNWSFLPHLILETKIAHHTVTRNGQFAAHSRGLMLGNKLPCRKKNIFNVLSSIILR